MLPFGSPGTSHVISDLDQYCVKQSLVSTCTFCQEPSVLFLHWDPRQTSALFFEAPVELCLSCVFRCAGCDREPSSAHSKRPSFMDPRKMARTLLIVGSSLGTS